MKSIVALVLGSDYSGRSTFLNGLSHLPEMSKGKTFSSFLQSELIHTLDGIVKFGAKKKIVLSEEAKNNLESLLNLVRNDPNTVDLSSSDSETVKKQFLSVWNDEALTKIKDLEFVPKLGWITDKISRLDTLIPGDNMKYDDLLSISFPNILNKEIDCFNQPISIEFTDYMISAKMFRFSSEYEVGTSKLMSVFVFPLKEHVSKKSKEKGGKDEKEKRCKNDVNEEEDTKKKTFKRGSTKKKNVNKETEPERKDINEKVIEENDLIVKESEIELSINETEKKIENPFFEVEQSLKAFEEFASSKAFENSTRVCVLFNKFNTFDELCKSYSFRDYFPQAQGSDQNSIIKYIMSRVFAIESELAMKRKLENAEKTEEKTSSETKNTEEKPNKASEEMKNAEENPNKEIENAKNAEEKSNKESVEAKNTETNPNKESEEMKNTEEKSNKESLEMKNTEKNPNKESEEMKNAEENPNKESEVEKNTEENPNKESEVEKNKDEKRNDVPVGKEDSKAIKKRELNPSRVLRRTNMRTTEENQNEKPKDSKVIHFVTDMTKAFLFHIVIENILGDFAARADLTFELTKQTVKSYDKVFSSKIGNTDEASEHENSSFFNIFRKKFKPKPHGDSVGEIGVRPTMEDTETHIDNLKKVMNSYKKLDSRISYYAIYDGHSGPHCSQIAKEYLHQFLFNDIHFIGGDIKKGLLNAFMKTEAIARSTIECRKCGSTAVFVVITGNLLSCACLGDTEAIICEKLKENKKISYVPHELTKRHTPDDPDEEKRIVNAGGMVYGKRVYGTLAVSRAFGDYEFKENKPIVSASPNIYQKTITRRDKFIVLACDGLWDTMTHSEVCDFVASKYKTQSASSVASLLVHEALERKSADNVSVTVVYLR